jgi:hypothetical protein
VQRSGASETELDAARHIPAMQSRARICHKLTVLGGACVGVQLSQTRFGFETAQNQRTQTGPALGCDRAKCDIAPGAARPSGPFGQQGDGLLQNFGEIFGDGCVPWPVSGLHDVDAALR